jgi:hypothetical protein
MNRMRIAVGLVATIAMVTAVPALAATRAGAGVLNGTYRVTISDADLTASGVTKVGDIRENHGRFTWVLRDGRWRMNQHAINHLFHPNVDGTYTVRGDRVSFIWPDGPRPTTLRWRRSNGDLRLTVVSGGDRIVRTLFTARPWKQIS